MNVYSKGPINPTPLSEKVASLRGRLSELIPNGPNQITRAWMQLGVVFKRLTGEEVLFDAPEDWEDRPLIIKHLNDAQADRLNVPYEIQIKRDRAAIQSFIEECEELFNQAVGDGVHEWAIMMLERACMELMEAEYALYSNKLFKITTSGITKTS